MSLTSTSTFEAYLKFKSFPFTSITELTGGSGNWVWRVHQPNGKTVIFKHAEPFVKINPAIPFPISRQTLEADVLALIPGLVAASSSVNVHLPTMYSHDSDAHVLQISDAGNRNLKEAYQDASLNIAVIGTSLGEWLAKFHAATKSTDIGNDLAGRVIYRHGYNNVSTALAANGCDPSLGTRVNEKYGALLQTDDDTVCHGDFWSGNILVADQTQADADIPPLTVVDWEMVRRGCGATDVGQFAAEAWLLDRFKGGRGLLPAFIRAYCRDARPDNEFVKRVAVHFGMHLAYWPTRVPWTDKAETQLVVELGAEMMRSADEENWKCLEQSELLRSTIE